MASGFKINKQGIRNMVRDIEREFAKTPVKVPINGGASNSSGPGGSALTGSELELVAGWLLDWGYAYGKARPGLVPSVTEMMADVGVENFAPLVEPLVEVAMALLEEEGLLREPVTGFGRGGMNLSVWLTESGQREAASRIERRRDNRARRSACRDAVLRWVYERDAEGESRDIVEIANSPYGWFNGALFSNADLADAIRYLSERHLLSGTGQDPTVEPAGIECIEQYRDVVEYLNRRDGAGVNVTIMGNNSGQLAVANRDVAQNLGNTNQAETLAIFANALREFGHLVPEGQRSEFQEVATALERESNKVEPNKGWVKALFERSKGLLENAPVTLHSLAQVMKVAFDIYDQAAS